jgi:hypothetical protein
MQIDESGRDDESVGVDYFFGEAGGAASELRDLAVFDPHVAAVARYTRSIDYGSAFNLNIEISHF